MGIRDQLLGKFTARTACVGVIGLGCVGLPLALLDELKMPFDSALEGRAPAETTAAEYDPSRRRRR